MLHSDVTRARRRARRYTPMRHLLIAALLLVTASSAGGVESQAMPTPQIVVDEEHSQFARFDGTEPPSYFVSPGPTVQLDASGYSFPVKADFGVSGPNLISLVMGKDKKYRLPWKEGVTKYVLSKDTLQAELGSVPFPGFRSGDTFAVIVSVEDPKESKPTAVNMKLLWGCLVRVK